MSDEEQDEHCVDTQSCPYGPFFGRTGHDSVEASGNQYVDADGFQRISDGVFLLSHDVGQEHGRGVSGETALGACHVAVRRDEDDVDGKEDQTTGSREPGPPNRLVDELVPKGKVEVNPHHDFGCHDNGDDT